jgi:hypothetical protein
VSRAHGYNPHKEENFPVELAQKNEANESPGENKLLKFFELFLKNFRKIYSEPPLPTIGSAVKP